MVVAMNAQTTIDTVGVARKSFERKTVELFGVPKANEPRHVWQIAENLALHIIITITIMNSDTFGPAPSRTV
jgi:hypothetical protein